MASNEPNYYKRMEDQKWRDGVNDRIAALTTSEVVQNDRLDDQDEELSAIRAILEGKADDKNDNGIKGDIHEISVMVNQLRAIMAPDQLGNGGVINRLKALERKAGLEERLIEGRWKFYGILAAAILSLAGLILTNLDRIEESLRNMWDTAAVMESTKPRKSSGRTNRLKRRRGVIQAPKEADDGDQTDVPERRSRDGGHAE